MDQQLQNSVRHEDFLRNALVKLKQRIFSFTQNTKIDPNNLFTALHNALDDVGVIVHEKIAFIDQQKKDWQDLAVDLVDEERLILLMKNWKNSVQEWKAFSTLLLLLVQKN